MALLRLSCGSPEAPCGSHGGKAQGIELRGVSQKNMTDFFVGVSSFPDARISPIGYHGCYPPCHTF